MFIFLFMYILILTINVGRKRFLFSFFEQLGWSPLGVGALRKLRTLRIGSSGTVCVCVCVCARALVLWFVSLGFMFCLMFWWFIMLIYLFNYLFKCLGGLLCFCKMNVFIYFVFVHFVLV